jgi:predicted nucleic-acid-binding protein
LIGVDTNVLIRWLIDEQGSSAQVALARQTIMTATVPILINPVVLAEAVWVLERAFGYPRDSIAALIRQMLDSPGLTLSERPRVETALAAFLQGGAGFADHFIAALNRAAGCATTLTFDKSAARSPDFTLLG